MKVKKNKNTRKAIVLASITAALLVGLLIWIAMSINKPVERDPIETSNGNSATPTDDVPNASNNNSSQSTSNTKDPNNSEAPSVDPSVTPLKPSGTFVSNHRPNIDGAPRPNTLSSVCTTTPGVYCTIKFNQNGIEKSLPRQKTNSDGNTSWNWSLQDIGLTQGSWSITAEASNGQRVSSENDPTPLTVEP